MIGLRLPSTLLLGACIAFAFAPAKAADAYDPWPGLVQDIFNNKAMQDGTDVLAIEMPTRAEDASVVPVTLRSKLSPADERRIRTITLVIDQNPAPLAAKFTLGADANVTAISTRVRVNNYTDVHAVAELSDGQLYVVKTFVKASGGCSAPAAKNPDEAKARIGQMRYRQFAQAGNGATSGMREAQVMVGHPNNSGLQMDQVTQQNAAMVEETTAASMALSDEAQTLKGLVARFRTSGQADASGQLRAMSARLRA